MHVCAPAADGLDARRAHTITGSSLEQSSTHAVAGAEELLSPESASRPLSFQGAGHNNKVGGGLFMKRQDAQRRIPGRPLR